MHYCISDIHGDYERYIEMLQTIDFCDKDVLYVVGDVVDRGKSGMRILLDMMMRANVYPILGNHEYMAIKCLEMLTQEITEESISQLDEDMMQGFVEWLNTGGQSTIDEFKALDKEQQEMVLEYLEEFALHEEVRVNGKDFVIVHAGIENFDESKPLEEYDLSELIFHKADYSKTYYKNKYLITGHTPTRFIYEEQEFSPYVSKKGKPSKYDKIFKRNNHIAIDCGCGYGGVLGLICLENMNEFYV